MKFTAKRTDFTKALKAAAACVQKNNMLPILNNALIEADGTQVKITCANLEQRITATVDAEIERGGKTTIPAKKLFSILSKLSADSVIIDTDDRFISTLTCGTVTATIYGLTPEDFIPAPDVEYKTYVSVAPENLAELFTCAGYAVSADDSRKVLQGVLFEIQDGKILAASTDGKRLALAEMLTDMEREEPASYIIPAAAVAVLTHLPGDSIELYFTEKYMNASGGGVEFTTKLIEGAFPNYQHVIPEKCEHYVTIEADVLSAKLGIISEMLCDNGYAMLTISDNKIDFQTGNDTGSIIDSMEIKETKWHIDPPVDLCFNPAFIVDAIRGGGNGEFTFGFKDGLSPCKLEFAGGAVAVVMPIRKK